MIKNFKLISFYSILSLFLFGCSTTQINPYDNVGYTESGKASYYAMKYHNRKTASGERLNQNAKTGAHKKLPFGTRVKVTNIRNGKSVIVRINDRGPFVRGRIIDLSRKAFKQIGDIRSGLLDVKIKVID